jgi:S-adenosylmethionine synthetase
MYPYDGKTQVTLDDEGNMKTIVASFQNVSKENLETIVKEWLDESDGVETILCNPAGDWNQGGFEADTGVTGRKLMVDNYGPQIPIGGGCFSGKDATKVDRSAAYMARHLAVKLLKGYKAKSVLVKLAYAIGIAEPVMAIATIESPTLKENAKMLEVSLTDKQNYLTPKGIIEFLDLRRPQYEKTAQWGHFGNGFTWDK